MTEYALTLPEIDLKKPLFMVDNLLELGTLGGDTESNLSALKGRFLGDSWQSPGYTIILGLALPAPASANAIGIANHTFNGETSIELRYSTNGGSTYTTSGVFLPEPGRTLFLTFPRVTGADWLIIIGAQTGLKIGYLAIGPTVDFERGAYAGVVPTALARETNYLIDNGETQYTGNRVIRERTTQQVEVSNLTAQWVRLYGAPLALKLRDKSAFYAWRSGKYQSDVVYGWSDGDAQMTHTGPRDLMNFSVTLRGVDQ
jgi:hypothetical protein